MSDALLPSSPLTRRHVCYLVLLQCLGAAIFDAAILFGIHVAVFSGADPVRLWTMPTTIAGDMFVSLLITCLLTWPIVGLVVWGDLKLRRIAPLGVPCIAAAAARGGFVRWVVTVSSVVDAPA